MLNYKDGTREVEPKANKGDSNSRYTVHVWPKVSWNEL